MARMPGGEQQVLAYLLEQHEKGIIPSIREICAAIGVKSTSTVHRYLRTLEEEGYITREENKNRCIVLNGQQSLAAKIPLLGQVHAGYPHLQFENVREYIAVPPALSGRRDLFALKVVGDSMERAGILEGDIVVVRRQPVCEQGEIVVALVDDEATVKRFYKRGESIVLHPENPLYEDIVATQVTILGKVVHLMRTYEEV